MRVELTYAVSIAAAVVTLGADSSNSDDGAGKRATSATAAPVDGMTAGMTIATADRAAASACGGVNEGPDNESSAHMAIQRVRACDIRIGGPGDRLVRNARFVAVRLSNGIHVAVTSSSRTALPQLQAVRLAANDAAPAERAILRNTCSVARDTAMSRKTGATGKRMAAGAAVPLAALPANGGAQASESVFALDDFKNRAQAVLEVAKL